MVSISPSLLSTIRTLADLVPYIDTLVDFADQVQDAGGPVRWARRRIVEYVLGAVAALIFGTADIIDQMWGIVIGAIDQAGAVVPQSIRSAGAPVAGLVADFHGAVQSAAGVAGPASPIIVVGTYAVVLYLWFLVLRAAAPALSNALGAVPVVGSLLDALFTWSLAASSRVSDYVGGGD